MDLREITIVLRVLSINYTQLKLAFVSADLSLFITRQRDVKGGWGFEQVGQQV